MLSEYMFSEYMFSDPTAVFSAADATAILNEVDDSEERFGARFACGGFTRDGVDDRVVCRSGGTGYGGSRGADHIVDAADIQLANAPDPTEAWASFLEGSGTGGRGHKVAAAIGFARREVACVGRGSGGWQRSRRGAPGSRTRT